MLRRFGELLLLNKFMLDALFIHLFQFSFLLSDEHLLVFPQSLLLERNSRAGCRPVDYFLLAHRLGTLVKRPMSSCGCRHRPGTWVEVSLGRHSCHASFLAVTCLYSGFLLKLLLVLQLVFSFGLASSVCSLLHHNLGRHLVDVLDAVLSIWRVELILEVLVQFFLAFLLLLFLCQLWQVHDHLIGMIFIKV